MSANSVVRFPEAARLVHKLLIDYVEVPPNMPNDLQSFMEAPGTGSWIFKLLELLHSNRNPNQERVSVLDRLKSVNIVSESTNFIDKPRVSSESKTKSAQRNWWEDLRPLGRHYLIEGGDARPLPLLAAADFVENALGIGTVSIEMLLSLNNQDWLLRNP